MGEGGFPSVRVQVRGSLLPRMKSESAALGSLAVRHTAHGECAVLWGVAGCFSVEWEREAE